MTTATNLADPTPVVAYVSSDGRTVTDWHGNFLGSVRSATRIPLARWSHVHGSHMTAFVVRLADGRDMWGRSSRGISINLRPYRNQTGNHLR